MELTTDQGYLALLQQISDTYTQGRMQAVQAVNTHITQTYWQVGRQIVEFEQGGKARAKYGKALISRLASDLGAQDLQLSNRSGSCNSIKMQELATRSISGKFEGISYGKRGFAR